MDDKKGESEGGMRGPQGPPGKRGRSSKLFKNLLIIWMVVFSLLVGWQISKNGNNIKEINKDKASISQLQQTNCAFKKFLLDAENGRYALYKIDKNPVRKEVDFKAAKRYKSFADSFQALGSNCKLPIESKLKLIKGKND